MPETIEFDPLTHTYTIDGHVVPSVTRLLSKHGLAPDYSAVSPGTMAAAAERGIVIHRELQEYCTSGEVGFTPECDQFAEWCDKNGAEPVDSERIVTNGIAAGTLDITFRIGENLYIGDFKSTAEAHPEAWAWQLSLYAAMDGRDFAGMMVFHFTPAGMRVIPVQPIPPHEIARLFAAEQAGEIYTRAPITVAGEVAELAKIEQTLAWLATTKKETEERAKAVRMAVIAAMEENGLYTIESDRIRLTYVAPSTKKTVDTARLKAEKPEVYNEYTKETPTAASLRVKIKEEK